MATKKQKLKSGNILKIDLGDGTFSFAQIVQAPLVRFFDFKTSTETSLDDILSHNTAFSIMVMDYAMTSENWTIIGNTEVPVSVERNPAFFKQDKISGKIYITYTGAEEELAKLEEVKNLECAAVWDPEHVEDRLKDFYASRPNKWVNALKPKIDR